MDKDTIRTILCYIRKHTFLVVLSLVLAAVTVVSTLYLPILTGHAIDCMIAKGKVDFAASSSWLCVRSVRMPFITFMICH